METLPTPATSPSGLPEDVWDSWRMTPETLWCAWGRPPAERVRIGFSKPVYQFWTLADPGAAGLAQVKEGLQEEFLAAMPFTSVLELFNRVQSTPAQSTDHVWPTWFKPATQSYVVLVQDPDKTLRTVALNAPSEEEAMILAAQEGVTVIMCGAMSDLQELIKVGQEVLDQEDYRRLLGDSRPVAPGHPIDWIGFMRDPILAQRTRDFIGKRTDGN